MNALPLACRCSARGITYLIHNTNSSAAAYCRARYPGVAVVAGGRRGKALGQLALRGLGAVDASTGKRCMGRSCSVLLGVECLRVGQKACLRDAYGNVGEGNIGQWGGLTHMSGA
jgi:hypothetical protein